MIKLQVAMSTTENNKTAQHDMSTQVADLKHSKQNRFPKLPPNTTIVRRPILHAPVAPPTASSHVEKVVYVSRHTPIMSAVKRVKKFLHEIERRALQSANVSGAFEKQSSKQGELERRLEEVSEKLQKDKEEVLVKASGRAIEQAMRVGEWFRSKEEEVMCTVQIRTGSVGVVDDIVEVGKDSDAEGHGSEEESRPEERETTQTVCGETTLKLLDHLEGINENAAQAVEEAQATAQVRTAGQQDDGSELKVKRKRKRRRKRTYDLDDLPEARLRYVKTVEIAISLRA